MNQHLPTVFLTSAGASVKPLRELTSEFEWDVFKKMRAMARSMSYLKWKEWAKAEITFANSCKVAKQLGLQTPGKQVPSSLFYMRLRASTPEGLLTVQLPRTISGADNGTV